MRWENKARIMRWMAVLPQHERLYREVQRRWGRLKPDPMRRLPTHVEMLRFLSAANVRVDGAQVFEVGTGHIPLVPLGFFLAGAAGTTTVDLNKRFEPELFRESLKWVVENQDVVRDLYRGASALMERIELIRSLGCIPDQVMHAAGIEYRAPCDASDTGISEGAFDIHMSVTTLEHIQPDSVDSILSEAFRVLRRGGVAVHFIDPSDHFQHQDPTITRINFLKYSESQWARLAHNPFAYTNRLRANEYIEKFIAAGFEFVNSERIVDADSMQALRDGFRVNDRFKSFTHEDLCTTTFRIVVRKP